MPKSLDKPVQLYLLGEFQLIVEGVDKTALIAYNKPKLLLAVLALSFDKKLSRAELAEMLWPNCAAGGRANLRHALCVLRQVMGPWGQALVSTSATLAVDMDLVAVDVLAVCGLGRYAQLSLKDRLEYDRGALLEHVMSAEYASVSAWCMSWQSRLAQEISQCRQTYIAQLRATGATEEALISARQWVQAHPHDEYAHRDLIRLLRDSGRHEAATKAYEHCVAVMGEHYGTSPSAETGALLDAMTVADTAGAATVSTGQTGARPLAVLAVAIVHQSGDLSSETGLEQVHKTRKRLIRLARAIGRRVCLGADGSLAVVFGYPGLNERPAEAAANLACHIQQFLVIPGISFCMGIHAGLVSIPLDHGALPMMMISQRALRLAYLAAPCEILLTEAAQVRLSDHFAVQPNERYGLRVSVLGGRCNTLPVHRMFGRNIEFDKLIHRWHSVSGNDRPHVMLLRGDQGLGKSLLLQVFAEYVRRGRGLVTLLRCDQENQHTALHPFQQFFLQRLSTYKDPMDDPVGDKIASGVRAMESLGYRVGLDKATSMRLADYFIAMRAADGAKGKLFSDILIPSLITLLLHRDSVGQPLLLIIDDAQWVDQATLDLLRALSQQIRGEPTLLLLGGRDTPADLSVDESILMAPLRQDAMVKMVNYWTRDKRMSSQLRRRIVEKAQGVPLYAEELVRQNHNSREIHATPLMLDLLAARALSLGQDHAARQPVLRTESALSMPFLEAE